MTKRWSFRIPVMTQSDMEEIYGFCKHTAKHKLMHVYTELNKTTMHTYRCSPINCRIEELSDEAFDIINQSKKQGKMLLLDWNDKGMDDNHFDPFFGGPSQVEDNSDAPQGNVDHVTGEEYNGDYTNGEEDNCDDTNSDEDNIADEEILLQTIQHVIDKLH
ncbi:hypothetical protein R6Q59_007851 [Mikania micrantha]